MTRKPHKSPWTAEYKKYDEKTWICNSCNAKIRAADGNTSNLKGHVKNRHKLKFDEIMKLVAVTEVKKKQVSLLFN